MSSTFNRRMKRKKEQDIKKGIYKPEMELNIPTEQELNEYISNKSKELRMTDHFDNMDEFFVKPVTPVIKRSNYPDTPDGQLAYDLTLWNKNNN